MAAPTKEDILKVYQAYLGQIDKINQQISMLQSFRPELNKAVTRLIESTKELQDEQNHVVSTAAMMGFPRETRDKIIDFKKHLTEITQSIESPLDKAYENNIALKATLSQLKTSTQEAIHSIEEASSKPKSPGIK